MKRQIEEYNIILSKYIELKAYLDVMFMLHDHLGGRHKIVDQTPLFLLPTNHILFTPGIDTNNDTCFIMKYHKCSHAILLIILLKSVGVRKLQVAIIARSSREMSLTDRIIWQYILSRVRVSVRPSHFFIRKKHPKSRGNQVAIACCLFQWP